MTPSSISAHSALLAVWATAGLGRLGRALLATARMLLLIPVLLVSALVLTRRQGWRAAGPQSAADPTTGTGPANLSAAPRPGVDLSVVVPFYNPGAALRPTIIRLCGVLRAAGVGFEVIAVSDGSTDGSEETVRGIDPTVTVLRAPVNCGKGAALRRGFRAASGAWVGFVDADGDIDPSHLVQYLALGQRGGMDAVYACKTMARSASGATQVRRLLSCGFSAIITALFPMGVRDTQTGCKVIRRETLAAVLPRLQEEKFALDLEFFVVAARAGFRRMRPAPVTLGVREAGSTVGVRTVLQILLDALTIFGRLHLTRAYSFTRPAATLAPADRPLPTSAAADSLRPLASVTPLPEMSTSHTLKAA